ncbi:MAG: hydroxymethylglutaryl-CoA lyase [Rhodothalassiaceae bacterium]
MQSVEIIEVGPRDGLQNEAVRFTTEDKLALIGRLLDAGVRRLEVASFVHPERVPQMADAEAVVAGLPDLPDRIYIGLVLNRRGALRALATREKGRGIDEIGVVAVASESFAMRNQGQTLMQGIESARDILRLARREGMRAQVTLSAVFGCPFEGEVPPDRVREMALAIAEAEPGEIVLADTIGVAGPGQVEDMISLLREALPDMPLRAHFHNTRNTGLANAWAAFRAGVTRFDASIGGLGGCPFAPAATGNIATEDLVYMLERSGVGTGLALRALLTASEWLTARLDRPLASALGRAGNFPPQGAAS